MCTSSTALSAGSSSEDLHLQFMRLIDEVLRKASAKKGASRSAADGQGHQKTPSFIEAVVNDAAKVLREEATLKEVQLSGTLPRGGFTDVGLHTGGEARRTCWPLVRELHKHLVCCSPTDCVDPIGLHRRFLAQFELWASEQQMGTIVKALAISAVRTVPPLDNGAVLVDSVVQMLERATASASSMVADGYDLPRFEERCKTVRQQLDTAMEKRSFQAAGFYKLPKGTSWISGEDPKFVLPPRALADECKTSLDIIQKSARRTIANGGAGVIQWMDKVEEFMYRQAARLRFGPAVSDNLENIVES
jgi:hypothetical protein